MHVRVSSRDYNNYVDLQNNASFSSCIICGLTWNAIVAFQNSCVAKFVHGVLLLYLVAPKRYIAILVAARVRKKLH